MGGGGGNSFQKTLKSMKYLPGKEKHITKTS